MKRIWISILLSGMLLVSSTAVWPSGTVKAQQLSETLAGMMQNDTGTEQLSESNKPEQEVKRLKRQTDQDYSMAYLNSLPYNELVDLLTSSSWTQIPELFKFNPDSRQFYENQDRFQSIIDALKTRGSQFTEDDDKGIPTLVEVLRSGYYLGYYNQELGFLNTREYKKKVLPAINKMMDNRFFAWGSATQNEVIGAAGKLISNTTVDTETVNRMAGLVKDFVEHVDDYAGDHGKSKAFYDVIQGIGYVLLWDLSEPDKQAIKGNIDAYLNPLFLLAKQGPSSADKVWLTNNAVYYTGELAHYHSNPDKANQVLTDSMNSQPRLSELFFTAARQISEHYAGKDYNGNRIDLEKLKNEGKTHYLPQRFSFDDGKFIFQTGGQLKEEQIQRLYWAAKEVKAQFHRVVGNDKALEKGNADDVLTVVIYNNPDEYRMNNYLYGYSTDNGGIYIEGIGTFFTYDRTAEQSTYSLEELFRHEFTHYLQGRYEVPGTWGRGPLYESGTMPWFEEGGAEFFAGATRTDSIQPRKSVVGNLRQDSPSQRYSVSQTLHAQYGSWKFYDYSFAMFNHLYQTDLSELNKINNMIRANDSHGYKDNIEKLSKDEKLNREFQQTIEQQISQYDSLSTPLVSDDYMEVPQPKNTSEIYAEIANAAGLSNVKTEEHESQFFKTFTLQGIYTGGPSKGKVQDWKTMNGLTDGFLKSLSGLTWNGYNTVTAYFTNYRVTEYGRFAYDVVFHGKLPEKENPGAGGNPDNGHSGNPNTDNEHNGNLSGDQEPNNTFKQASQLKLKQTVSGTVGGSDYADIYRFEVKHPGQLDILLEADKEQGVAWLLYHESDLQNYTAYPDKVEGKRLSGSHEAKAGTYYLYVYSSKSVIFSFIELSP
ncbi:collagenase [Paenibacillus larvae]|uniref:collagenase n=1 Tax=Paenibacillus larvae TaxID=1464 RepID=UPI0039173047